MRIQRRQSLTKPLELGKLPPQEMQHGALVLALRQLFPQLQACECTLGIWWIVA